jgi:hypothetical protein
MTKINNFLNEIDFYLSTLETDKKSKTSIKIAEDFRVIINNNQDLLIKDYNEEKQFNPDFVVLQRKFDNAIQKLNEADDLISTLQQEKQQFILHVDIAQTSINKLENTNIINKNLIDELERLLSKSKQENKEKEIIIKELKTDKKPTELLKKVEDDNLNLKLKCAEYEKLFSEYQLHIIELENKIHTLSTSSSTSPPNQSSKKNPLIYNSNNITTLHDEIMFINQQEEFHKVKKEYKELYDYNRRLKIEVSNLRDELERIYFNQQNDDLCCCPHKSCIIT